MRVERRDPAGIWGRRIVAVPVFAAATLLAIVLLPVMFVCALLADAFRRKHLVTTRVVLLVVSAMLLEVCGLLAAFTIWIVTGFGVMREAFGNLNRSLDAAWGGLLFRMTLQAFRVEMRVEGLEVTESGPLLIFMRHTSVADTLAPAELIARRTGLLIRYVLKRELLWAPGINVMGTRRPNCFVRRGAGGESRYVGMLAEDLGPRDAVLIYPEGMVLTPAKAASKTPKGNARRSKPFERVHPPRLGGPLALLERAQGRYDVVFVGHVGFEVAPGVRQLLRGDLMDAKVRFGLWRVPGSSVPRAKGEMAEWLNERWHDMDDWVAQAQDELGVRAATR